VSALNAAPLKSTVEVMMRPIMNEKRLFFTEKDVFSVKNVTKFKPRPMQPSDNNIASPIFTICSRIIA
jgi:hypothetical protein